MELRQIADYGKGKDFSPEESARQLGRAEQFLDLAERLIGSVPGEDQKQV
jgi:hypothetical protein